MRTEKSREQNDQVTGGTNVVPLACGGPGAVPNMPWQTVD
jgi:hypothetical protein